MRKNSFFSSVPTLSKPTFLSLSFKTGFKKTCFHSVLENPPESDLQSIEVFAVKQIYAIVIIHILLILCIFSACDLYLINICNMTHAIRN